MNNFLYDNYNTKKLEYKLQKNGIPSLLLMMRAGFNLYQIVKENIEYEEIIVLAGPGNNGGDAISFAIQAKLNNEKITCLSLAEHKNNSKKLLLLSEEIGLKVKKYKNSLLKTRQKTLILDGILGIGITRNPSGAMASAIRFINKLNSKNNTVVSIDIPSGLDPNNGVAYPNTILAKHTIMCLTRKQGCYTGDGIKYSGKLYYSNLGINKISKIENSSCILLNNNIKVSIKRDKTGYKGNFGNILILGGWDNMPGAANLSALAALKTGCGKVYICTNNHYRLPNEAIRIMPEISDVLKIIEKINVIIAGPGLGNKGSEILKLLWKKNIPLILDADGINCLAKSFHKKRKSLLIGTPHYGEARKLLGKDFKDRFSAVKTIKKKYGGKWILKGPGTLILNNKIFINNFANSILASSGSGDVLAGIIGGLVAQKHKNPELAGVKIQTYAAKLLLKDNNRTLIATDLLNKISLSIHTI